MSASVKAATGNLEMLASQRTSLTQVLVREGFVYRTKPAPGDPSDRKLPPREDRPPATRITSPRGADLRFFLTALFEAQAQPQARAGTHPHNPRPLLAPSDHVSWSDLLASDARASGGGKTVMGIAAKKARIVKEAIGRLAAQELVMLPNASKVGNKYEAFELMHEGGKRASGPNVPYQLPRSGEDDFFALPVTLFTRGWIHVLEDTELTFLLMLAACQGASKGEEVRIPARARLLHFGIGRDAYEAHVMLSRLHLVRVTDAPDRHGHGKMKNFGNADGGEGPQPLLHTLGLLPDAFDRPALATLVKQIEYQLSR